jgi:hypothetical protein
VEQAQELFAEGDHLFCFDGADELAAVCTRILSEPGIGSHVAQKARARVFDQHLLGFRIDKIVADLTRCPAPHA